jgi:hypothetical protein
LKIFWLMTCAVAGTSCAKAQQTAALAARIAFVDGMMSGNEQVPNQDDAEREGKDVTKRKFVE